MLFPEFRSAKDDSRSFGGRRGRGFPETHRKFGVRTCHAQKRGPMTRNESLDQLAGLYFWWRDAMASRSAGGDLRASQQEAEALARFLMALDDLPEDLRPAWAAARASFEQDELASRCACGHPIPHHDERGSCFHVIGCGTGCACGESG